MERELRVIQIPPTAQVVMYQLVPPGKVLPESATVRNNIRLNTRNVNSSSKFTYDKPSILLWSLLL